MFLVPGGNRFPTSELQAQRTAMMVNPDPRETGICGELSDIQADGTVTFTPDLQNRLVPASYPVDKNSKDVGCVVIFEFPDEELMKQDGVYIAGLDPYDHDQAASSTSLGSILIFKSFRASTLKPGVTSEILVAEYTGRPSTADEFYETTLRLLTFYNAKVLYENEKIMVKSYYQRKNCLWRLAETPTILKASVTASVTNRNNVGINMTIDIKKEGEQLLKEYLTQSVSSSELKVVTIKSIPVLSELIDFNLTGNFDRVIAFMLVIIYNLQLKSIYGESDVPIPDDLVNYLRKRLNPRKHTVQSLIQR